MSGAFLDWGGGDAGVNDDKSLPFFSLLPTVSKGKCKRRRVAFGEKETTQAHFLRASLPILGRLVFLVPASCSWSIPLPYEPQNAPRMEECSTYSLVTVTGGNVAKCPTPFIHHFMCQAAAVQGPCGPTCPSQLLSILTSFRELVVSPWLILGCSGGEFLRSV